MQFGMTCSRGPRTFSHGCTSRIDLTACVQRFQSHVTQFEPLRTGDNGPYTRRRVAAALSKHEPQCASEPIEALFMRLRPPRRNNCAKAEVSTETKIRTAEHSKCRHCSVCVILSHFCSVHSTFFFLFTRGVTRRRANRFFRCGLHLVTDSQ